MQNVYVQNTFSFTFSQKTKAIYIIIQDNLVHKRLDCVNIVLSFCYRTPKNNHSPTTNTTVLLLLLYAVSKKETHIYYPKIR